MIRFPHGAKRFRPVGRTRSRELRADTGSPSGIDNGGSDHAGARPMPAVLASDSAAARWAANSGGMSPAAVPLVETVAVANTSTTNHQTVVMAERHTEGALFTTWITAEGDRRDHAVTDEAVASRWKARRPAYEAVCGYSVWPVAMESPPGPYCPHCLTRLRSHALTSDVAQRRRRAQFDFRPNILVRILRRGASAPKRQGDDSHTTRTVQSGRPRRMLHP